MAIQTTPNLGLIKPTPGTGEPGSNWPTQNANNCDTLDIALGFVTDTYTPDWTSSGTNPTLGTGGFVRGRFVVLHNLVVHLWIEVFMGTSGFNAGSGNYSLSFPSAAMPDEDFYALLSTEVPLGPIFFRDQNTVANSGIGVALYRDTDPPVIGTRNEQAHSVWSATTPFVPENSDAVGIYATYLKAPD